LPVSNTKLGFVAVQTPPGNHEIELAFPMPPENRVGWTVTGITLAALIFLLFRPRLQL
jgi:uncharacterized membrane protein YfhO